ncbi:ribosomal-protein-serine acetyltransferase [Stackebrandtia endophytica]|uniref:Ribosomal-protein-serine acetyltransferase n=1 Tax=Stackebrandtia endophytica TaxID=1496996 RepID=A0A543B2C7_9ACTN|nr:GNAT family N-acetyltransferase [Stackebrandtia endophytica]TQL78987.1 ribosomal-protein-serine acetyltransferase [Stackebrandtia endophytica]
MREPLADLATADPDLRLVELTATDARDYHDLLRRSHVHLTEFGDYDREVDSTFEEILAHFEKPADRHHRYGIRLSDRLIGRIDLNPVDPPRYSIGYWLGVDALGRGYATLAAQALITHAGAHLAATEIYAGVTHGNHRSVAVLARLGFTQVADFDEYTRFRRRLDDRLSPEGAQPEA